MLGIVLAGGLSSRMGRNKALMVYQGQTLLERAFSLLQNLTDACFVSCRDPSLYPGYPTLCDRCARIGPLGALQTSLLFAEEVGQKTILLLACDMPCIDRSSLLRLVAAHAARKKTQWATLYVDHTGKREVLCALYETALLPTIALQIASGDYAVAHLLPEDGWNCVPVAHGRLCTNVNTMAEYEQLARA